MQYWLLKSEPDAYSWSKLVTDGQGHWDGVRNHRAASNLRKMKVGDRAFFYHSNIGKEIVGVVAISEEGFPDPSDTTGKWVSVKVKPVKKLARPVTLAEIKAEERLADSELVRQSRLSVCEFTPAEWKVVLEMAGV